ncbi:hypothetical protein G6O67_006244 [Ophiocordyceps sinensis]|uniref:Uncharacterized protein n=1 Tax=Ophiocordyceps sinensis TaxID=72228 RepID=A0A8H4LVZ3_9HYPO|nr:hypothetical protein G6O67_006244 [Ophiocordyceps sinensis]
MLYILHLEGRWKPWKQAPDQQVKKEETVTVGSKDEQGGGERAAVAKATGFRPRTSACCKLHVWSGPRFGIVPRPSPPSFWSEARGMQYALACRRELGLTGDDLGPRPATNTPPPPWRSSFLTLAYRRLHTYTCSTHRKERSDHAAVVASAARRSRPCRRGVAGGLGPLGEKSVDAPPLLLGAKGRVVQRSLERVIAAQAVGWGGRDGTSERQRHGERRAAKCDIMQTRHTSADGLLCKLQRLLAAARELGSGTQGLLHQVGIGHQVAQQAPGQGLVARNWPAEQNGTHRLSVGAVSACTSQRATGSLVRRQVERQ